MAANETATTLTVSATSDFDTSKSGTAAVTVTTATSIEQNFISDLKIYPNPFTSVVRITGLAEETRLATSLQIINASGVVVHSQKIDNDEEIIVLENLPDGLYLFRFEKDGKTKTVRVVKIH